MFTWTGKAVLSRAEFWKSAAVNQGAHFIRKSAATAGHEIPAKTPARQHHSVLVVSRLTSWLEKLANKVVGVPIAFRINQFPTKPFIKCPRERFLGVLPEGNHVISDLFDASVLEGVGVGCDVVGEIDAVA